MRPKRAESDRPVLMEVCVESVDDAVAAAAAGAGRIELNSALSLDGLTPSPGLLVETRRAVRIPLVAMARPRAGNFCYSDSDIAVLRRDVAFALESGADGVAFGVLTTAGNVDLRRCRRIIRQINDGGGHAVFHRAFDAVTDPFDALEALVDLGVRRIMTSGGRATAGDGAAVIAQLVRRAAGRIEILPAGGVRPGNVFQLLRTTGCDQFHTSLRDRTGKLNRSSLVALGGRLRPYRPTRPQ